MIATVNMHEEELVIILSKLNRKEIAGLVLEKFNSSSQEWEDTSVRPLPDRHFTDEDGILYYRLPLYEEIDGKMFPAGYRVSSYGCAVVTVNDYTPEELYL